MVEAHPLITKLTEFGELCRDRRGKLSLEQQREHRHALVRTLGAIEREGQGLWGSSWSIFHSHGELADNLLGQVQVSSFFTTQHQKDIAFVLWHPDLREKALKDTIQRGKNGALHLRPLNSFKGQDIRKARASMVAEASHDTEMRSLISHPYAGGPWGPQDRPMASFLQALRIKIRVMTMKADYCDVHSLEYTERETDRARHPCTFDAQEFERWRVRLDTRMEVECTLDRVVRRVERSMTLPPSYVSPFIPWDTDTDSDNNMEP
jgi:hypothetical protein